MSKKGRVGVAAKARHQKEAQLAEAVVTEDDEAKGPTVVTDAGEILFDNLSPEDQRKVAASLVKRIMDEIRVRVAVLPVNAKLAVGAGVLMELPPGVWPQHVVRAIQECLDSHRDLITMRGR